MTSGGNATTGPQRVTRQRVAVSAVLEQFEDFRSAQQIHEVLRRKGESVGLTTVYRALQNMADAGELDVLRNEEGEAAYRRCSTGHHHHLVCRSCGRTVEIKAPEVERWAEEVAAAQGFREVRHDLEIFGTCGNC
ncbi:Fur family transcriptional regulator [Naumannella halotolerans]|uniref:Fur family ferric uptake transcriptional regulator n=1 Tax=Naumannella halotolerans TaxID=993414 RepID=A0A4R7J8K6_9ACTN|nr:Fur family transcriptional regulator [Naumannella halotolerans]TDT33842.1 Fur family ferric uptake transcriptional regulator [Naumannella halotolerans]